MKRIYKGKYKLRIAREYPYYATGGRSLHKVLFYKFGISVSIWVYYDTAFPDYSNWALKRINKIFPGAEIDEYSNIHWEGKTYYRDSMKWILSNKFDLKPTEHPQVMFDEKSQKYIGYSHRGRASFGIGDMLFSNTELTNREKSEYYKNRKYRRKYLLTLLKYHIKNDWIMFKDLCEDEIIGHGIMSIVPYREKGHKRIETKEEAFQAATNFAEYIS